MTPKVGTLYQHVQSTAAAEWVIEHWQGGYPIVDVYVDVSGVLTKIIPQEITYTDANTVTVTFSSARSGYAAVA